MSSFPPCILVMNSKLKFYLSFNLFFALLKSGEFITKVLYASIVPLTANDSFSMLLIKSSKSLS
jgi:hypothetical protein